MKKANYQLIKSEIITMDLKRSFFNLLGWTLPVAALMLIIIVLYPTVAKMYETLPPALEQFLKQFGGIPDNAVTYFVTEGALLLQIFGAIFATVIGYNTITLEEKEKTVDLFYSLPLTRCAVFLNKLLSVVIKVGSFWLVITLFCFLGFFIIGQKSLLDRFLVFSLLDLLMFLMFSLWGFSFGALGKLKKGAATFLLPFLFYAFSLISSFSDNAFLKSLKYLTPFSFSDPVKLLKSESEFEPVIFIAFFVLTVLFLLLANKKFSKREFY